MYKTCVYILHSFQYIQNNEDTSWNHAWISSLLNAKTQHFQPLIEKRHWKTKKRSLKLPFLYWTNAILVSSIFAPSKQNKKLEKSGFSFQTSCKWSRKENNQSCCRSYTQQMPHNHNQHLGIFETEDFAANILPTSNDRICLSHFETPSNSKSHRTKELSCNLGIFLQHFPV